jgi:hypothetical protein
MSSDDWRLRGQEGYLQSASLRWEGWRCERPEWDHDHCAFCWAKFAEQKEERFLNAGFTNGYHWVCASCFEDFRDRFGWRVESG